MLLNTFHGKQYHTFKKIYMYKLHNRTTKQNVLNGKRRFKVVCCSQCIGRQKRERRERSVKIAPDAQRIRNVILIIGCKKNSLSFALHI